MLSAVFGILCPTLSEDAIAKAHTDYGKTQARLKADRKRLKEP